jgi:hypothetical protein
MVAKKSEIIHQYCFNDETKAWPRRKVDQVQRWQRDEEVSLRSVCLSKRILYCAIETKNPVPKVTQLLELILKRVRRDIVYSRKWCCTALVLDADKTLSAVTQVNYSGNISTRKRGSERTWTTRRISLVVEGRKPFRAK